MRLRVVLLLLLLAPLAGAGWLIVQLGIADARAPLDPEQALQWWPKHRQARVDLLQSLAVTPEQAPRIQAEARALLANSPLAGNAYRALAQVAEIRRDGRRIVPMYTVASRRAPRDRAPHAWLANHHALRGEFVQALFHVDQLLRLAPNTYLEMQPTLEAFAAIPEARVPLLRLLGEQAPPWRTNYLRAFSTAASAAPVLSDVFSPLRAAPVPLDATERAFWIDRLLQESRAGEAYFVWIDGLSPERRAVIGNVYDGGFELLPENRGFGWIIGNVAGATVRQEPMAGMSGQQALVIDFHDRRVPFEHVRQRLALPAGDFMFSGRARLDGIRNERGLQWVIRCDSGSEIAASKPFTGSSNWRSFDIAFTRPPQSCNGQTLILRLDARIAPEQMIGGRIAFDDLRIVAEKH